MADTGRARFQQVLHELQAAVGADRGAALYLDDGDGALSLVASVGPRRERNQSWQDRFRMRGADTDVRTLIVPVPDAAGGMLMLERSGTTDFTRDDRALASLYARQLTDGMSVDDVFRRSVWARQLEAIQRIAGQLTRLATVEEVGAAICRETRQVVEYDEAHVLLGDAAALTTVAAAGGALGDQTPTELSHDGMAGAEIRRAVTSATPLLVPECVAPSPDRPGTWALLVVPMRYDRQVIGAIALLRAASGGFDGDNVRLLQILADQAAVAMQNARLLAGRDELVRELEALLDISTAASQPTEERVLAAQLAAKLRRASRMDACVISRWDATAMTLLTIAADGIEAPASSNIVDFAATRGVLIDRRPRVVQAGDGDDAAGEARALAELGGQTLLMLPLSVAGRQIGLVELISLSGRRSFAENEMQAYQTMAGSIAAGLENQRLVEQLRLAADIDQVTGVHNHRYLHERLRQEVARSARSRAPLCVLMLDLDDFKPVNDRFGHAEGDRVLNSIAATIRAHVRTNDIVARYGGDEFVVVMPDTPAAQAHDVAKRVVEGVATRRHDLTGGATVRVGLSAGLSVYPEDGRSAAQLLQVADANMYDAKRATKSGARPRETMDPAFAPAPG